jgi:hypothetical protein
MKLWFEWLAAVKELRGACHRTRTFVWMVLSLAAFSCRVENVGVTSFVRALNFQPKAYHRFLHFFHSTGVDLDQLTALWVRLCLTLFRPFQVGTRLVCVADGIKAPKEGKKMPAVKSLHQQSASNTKPEHIMGHSLQAVSLLVNTPAGQVAAIPLTSRIHEGVVFSNRDQRTLLDKMAVLLMSITKVWDRQVILVADAYYACAKIIKALLEMGHQLVSRAKGNTVAYYPPEVPAKRSKGRPRTYGKKVALRDLAKQDKDFIEAPSPVYGEQNVLLRYLVADLLWRPVKCLVRFVIVKHPIRGTIFLLCTDLTLSAIDIIALYGHRFKIEVGFRQAVHVIGAYAYHFWMMAMKPLQRGQGDQYLHRTSADYRNSVRRKLRAYHLYVQLGCIAQGLLLHLAINHANLVWQHFRGWLRTIRYDLPPSELIVSNALNSGLPEFIASPANDEILQKIIREYLRSPQHSSNDETFGLAAAA